VFPELKGRMTAATLQAADVPLPAWNDGPAKASILMLV
jgi:hypothetical protein